MYATKSKHHICARVKVFASKFCREYMRTRTQCAMDRERKKSAHIVLHIEKRENGQQTEK